MRPFLVLWLLVVTLLLACAEQPSGPIVATPSPPTVGALRLAAEPYRPTQQYLARVQASATASIRPQVSGLVTTQHFVEGSQVRQGQALYDINPEAYQAAAELAKARVAEAEAAVEITSVKSHRVQSLRALNSVSQQEADEVRAELRQAKAQLDLALAMLKQAEIDLHNCVIRAPIDGVIGESRVTVGALVSASQSDALAVVQRLQPVWVDIQRPLNDQLRMDAAGAEVRLKFEDGSEVAEIGRVRLVENRVDQSTNSLLTRAEFANVDQQLIPGMRTQAVLTATRAAEAIFIPINSFRRLPSGKGQVMLVNSQSRIELRTVDLAEIIGDRWRVTSGLEPGDLLVTSGLQQLQPDMQVQVNLLEPKTRVER